MRNVFERELKGLNDAVLAQAERAEALLRDTRLALLALDGGGEVTSGTTPQDTLQRIAGSVEAIYRDERAIEKTALALLLLQQPVASDLALVSIALKTVTDWSRIGVQVGDMAELLVKSASSMTHEERVALTGMMQAVDAMLLEALRVMNDTSRDRSSRESTVFALDDQVDEAFRDIRDHTVMEHCETTGSLTVAEGKIRAAALDVLLIAKYLERMGDHACRVVSWIEFSRSGFEEARREAL